MVTRAPAQPLFWYILRFGIGAALAFTLFCAGFSVSSALAANIYKYSDGSEGDPGDGVLSPRAVAKDEDKNLPIVFLDDNVISGDHGYVMVPVFTNWTSPGAATLRFLLIPRPGYEIVTGADPWYSTFSGRWWNHAR